MIGSLRGKIMVKQAPEIIVECNGVGYELETPMSTFLELPNVGEDVFLHTHLLVREDAQILYGFRSLEERSLFRLLLKVKGVGAKIGLAILSTMTAGDFQRCLEYEDFATLKKIPGVGEKTARQIVLDLKGKLGEAPAIPGGTSVTIEVSPRSEAVDALMALGYKAKEVNKLISGLHIEDQSAEEIIRMALKQVAH
jgi:Holliday junction DNA helicase RuvA